MHTKLCQMPRCTEPAWNIIARFCEEHEKAWVASPEAAALQKGAYHAAEPHEGYSPLISALTDFVNRHSRENK